MVVDVNSKVVIDIHIEGVVVDKFYNEDEDNYYYNVVDERTGEDYWFVDSDLMTFIRLSE